jgi:hypothetical protein
MRHVATDCCGAKVYDWGNPDGASEDWCRDCGEQLCSSCAAVFELEVRHDRRGREDGYGEGGQGVCTLARCKACQGDLCERCGKGPKAGAAGLCQACNDLADAEAEREYKRQHREWRNDSGV